MSYLPHTFPYNTAVMEGLQGQIASHIAFPVPPGGDYEAKLTVEHTVVGLIRI